VLGAILGLWSLRRVEVALVGLVAVLTLLPFGVVPVRLGAAPTLLDLATAAVFVLWLRRAAAGRAPALVTRTGAALAVYAGVLVAAYVFSSEALRPDETARTFGKLVAAHLLFVPLLNLLDTRRRVRLVAGSLLALATLEAVIGLALYVAPRGVAQRALDSLGSLGYPTGGSVLRYLPDTDRLRAVGTAVDPNMLGALLMVAAAVAVLQVLAPRPAFPRPLVALALAPLGACLLLTYSRSSWLGLAAGVLLVGGLRYRRLWVACAVAGLLALAVPQAAPFTGHLGSGLRAEDRAAAMRLGELENARRIIAAHPWFGVGWGQGGQSIELEFTLGVSNVFLTVAERAGLVALVAYLAALAALARHLWPALSLRSAPILALSSNPKSGGPPQRAIRGPAPAGDPRSLDDGLLLGSAAALVAALVAGMLDHHFVRFPHLVSLLWLVAALAVATAQQDPPLSAVQGAEGKPHSPLP
jgi:O-antigen ligase